MLNGFIRAVTGRRSIHGGTSPAGSPAEVVAALEALPSLDAKVEYLRICRQFRVDQRKPEFMQFLRRVEQAQPKRILEIGGRRGGSSLLLSIVAPDATVISMDIDYGHRRLQRLETLCAGKSIQFWQGDSHSPDTVKRVSDWLEKAKLDVLFIDGDHRLEGAKADFCTYQSLVAEGGLIGLHDIQPDYKTRFDVKTLCWSGGVPALWNQIRAAGYHCDDLISDEWQDGYGIGLVTRSAGDSDCLKRLQSESAGSAAS